MKVSRFIFNMFGINTYVVWDPESREAAIVDPGMIDNREREALADFIERNGLRPTQLINTHMHLDHIFGDAWTRDRYGLKVKAGAEDEFLGLSLRDTVRSYGLPLDVEDTGIDVTLRDGDTIRLGDETMEVIAVPGHSPGSIALYCPESGFVITGDALFKGSIGRTDLPRGDFATLVGSVRRRLLTLPPETVVLPGHGEETTIGDELRTNPFVR
ncbi:MAG: MBL fold metallo-hydrolase [Duncaniella sp.]|nr:MBL fold metallo-hydrolase [Duncaniella sp.]